MTGVDRIRDAGAKGKLRPCDLTSQMSFATSDGFVLVVTRSLRCSWRISQSRSPYIEDKLSCMAQVDYNLGSSTRLDGADRSPGAESEALALSDFAEREAIG